LETQSAIVKGTPP